MGSSVSNLAVRRVPAPANLNRLGRHAYPDLDGLSSLLAAIYDAAIAPGSWPDVLAGCRDFVGGFSASIFAKDTAGLAGGIFHTDGRVTPHYARLYFETYARLDPTTGAHLMTPVEHPICNSDIIEGADFYESRFYLEWAQPQGLIDFVTAPLEKRGNWGALFGIMRHADDGYVDRETKHRFSLLVPHVRRSVLIGKVIEQRSFEAASFGDALDGLASAMFLLDADCRLVHANQSGREMLNSGGPVEARGGLLRARSETQSTALATALSSAAIGDAALGIKGISLALADAEGEAFAAHLLPLTSGSRKRTGIHYAAVAALFVQPATLDVPEMPETIARTYQLTLTELRVMITIATGCGVQETAEALGVAESTVKTHLHRVFAKTGTSRQADLVRLVAGFASPLAG